MALTNSLAQWYSTASADFLLARSGAEHELARTSSEESASIDLQTASADSLSVTVGGSVSGDISVGGETDTVTVNLTAGQVYYVSLQGSGGTPLPDTIVTINAPGGALVVQDDDGGTAYNSFATFTATTTGTYTILVNGYGSAIGGYTVDVRQVTSDSVAGDFTTTSAVTIGQTTFGALETSGDVDTYAVTLQAGTIYNFELAGGADYNSSYPLPSGEVDTRITIYDSAGNVVASNDDISSNDLSSALTFSPGASGTYYVQVDSYGGETGGYALDVSEQDLSQLDPLDSIRWGTQLGSNSVTVYFAPAGEQWDGVTSMGWSPYEMEQVMESLQTWANVTGLTFTVTTDSSAATFRLVTTENVNFLGYFNPPGTTNAGVGVFARDGAGWDTNGGLEPGGYGWITLIHEFGHGLGLAHPHDTGGTSDVMAGVTSPFGSYGEFDLNQGVYTTMSYNDGWQLHPSGMPSGLTYGYQAGPGALDIAVVQQLYGANASYNGGNNVYVLPAINAAGTFWTTIWDTGGTDSIVHEGTVAATIDLTAATLDYSATGGGVISFVDGIFGGFTIANRVVIENATGGAGNDMIVGNSVANVLQGRGGNDTLNGNDGNDSLYGGAGGDILIGGNGNDRLNGAADNDTIYGGAGTDAIVGGLGNDRLNGGTGADDMAGGGGNDIFIVDDAGDVVTEAAGEGGDVVWASVSHTLAANVERLTLTGSAAIDGTGNGLSNIIRGNGAANTIDGGAGHDSFYAMGGNDTLVGGLGSDRLNGGTGADTMTGGAGNDIYVVENAGDLVSEAAGEGGDIVWAGISYTLTANVERLTLTGSAAINGTGNALDNLIRGNGAGNRLDGAGGNDRLIGMGSGDTLIGGAGNDVLTGGAGGDAFLFNATLNSSSNVDRIGDFSVLEDTIHLDDDVFTAAGATGTLAAAAFRTGTAAQDADDRIIYDSATGRIYYDADGNGSGAQVLFAQVTAGLALTNADFLVIG